MNNRCHSCFNLRACRAIARRQATYPPFRVSGGQRQTVGLRLYGKFRLEALELPYTPIVGKEVMLHEAEER